VLLFHLRNGLTRWALAASVVSGIAALPVGAAATPRPVERVQAYRVPVAHSDQGLFHLYAQERGQGAPILLLHGLGGSTYSWRHVAPVLARTHRVIALDLKGFGQSDKAFDTAYSAHDQAQLVIQFLQQRNLRHVTVIGHSFGGQVALLAALALKTADPTRIRQLVLIDTPALPQPLSPMVRIMHTPVLPYALATLVHPEIMAALTLIPGQHVERAPTHADATAYAAPFYAASARHAYVQTARQIVPPGFGLVVSRYRKLRHRTLLVWCTRDNVVPVATGRQLTRLMPNAQLQEISGCNHSPPDEAPIALTRTLTRFLTTNTFNQRSILP
jgi:pimeloyl-ACP methyl ester carboxylesterase